MNQAPHPKGYVKRETALICSIVIGIAVTGYFVGINDGVPRENPVASSQPSDPDHEEAETNVASVMPAVTYSEVRRRENGPTSQWKPSLDQIRQPKFDLFAEIKPSESDKLRSTATRASRRAFNGAPPVIPHAVEKTADAACFACHGEGMRIGDRVANRMSHGFLANCMQCHSPPPPKPFAEVDASVATTFVGLPAPVKGKRAFPGAPPTIPHSTWMRERCLACHGHEAGWAGLESTHPWRINCTQCHVPSAALEQGVASAVDFLPGLNIKSE